MPYVTASGAEIEEEPVIYIRYATNASYWWATLKNDVDVSNKPNVCACGTKVSLHPCFTDPTPLQSTTVAVGSKIYSFGGYDVSSHEFSDQVSYIDTLRPEDGWKVCKSKMLRAQCCAYALALDDKEAVFVVGGTPGGTPGQCSEPTFTQMYYPKRDKWVHLENKFDNPEICGHAVVANGDAILMHSCDSPGLYSYVVDKNSWGRYWGDDFGEDKHSSALVDGIYYVLDISPLAIQQNLHFSGYDIFLESPNCLPVEVNLGRDEKDDEEWMPYLNSDGCSAVGNLVSLGNSKLAIVWDYICVVRNDPHDPKLSIWCSIFRMIKEYDNDNGALKLVAQPLSNVGYHLDGHTLDRCLSVDPSQNINTKRKRKMIEEERE